MAGHGLARSVAIALIASAPAALAQSQPSAPHARPLTGQPAIVAGPEAVAGVESESEEPGDGARTAADVALFIPRNVVDLLFITTGTAAGLVEDEQVVPRLKDTFFSEHHEIGVFPTAFVETGFAPNIGARMIASVDNFASTLRAGYGGRDTNVIESRIRFARFRLLPVVLSLEWLYDRRTNIGYPGLGPDPENDPRNAFRPGIAVPSGAYREVRERTIASVGIRPVSDVEILVSTSYKARQVDDAPGAGTGALSEVFVPGTVPGFGRVTRSTYTEVAGRFDSRVGRGAPATGAMVEAYSGFYKGVSSHDADAFGVGARWAAYFPLYRVTNILSPRIAIDGIVPMGTVPLAFNDYQYATDFRGFESRRDKVAMVASLDYRWMLMKFLSARMFADATNVAPELQSLGLDKMRYAGGFGFDLHSTTTQLGRIAAAFSENDVRLFLSLGVAPSGFGDRQHR